jgi:hypothetical protein
MPLDVPWYITFEFEPAVHIGAGSTWEILDGDGDKNTAALLHMGEGDTQGLPGTVTMRCMNDYLRAPWLGNGEAGYSVYFGRVEKYFPNLLIEMPAGILAELDDPTGTGPDPLVGACVKMQSQFNNGVEEWTVSAGFVLPGEESPIYPDDLTFSGWLAYEEGQWVMKTDTSDLQTSTEMSVDISLAGHSYPDSTLNAGLSLSISQEGEGQVPGFTLGLSGEVRSDFLGTSLQTIDIGGKLIYDADGLDGYLDVDVTDQPSGPPASVTYTPASWGVTEQ